MTRFKDQNTGADWPYITQGPKRNPFIDPGTNRGWADGTGTPYNIVYQKIDELFPGGYFVDPFSAKMVKRMWGANPDGTGTGAAKLDAAGIKQQVAGQYLPNTVVGKFVYSTGIGIGGGARVTLWWADGTSPQQVIYDGFPDDNRAHLLGLAEPCPVPANAFPAIRPPVQIRGSDGSDQSMVVYEPATDRLWEFEKTQKALHFPQVPQGYPGNSGAAKSRLDIVDPTGGAPGLTAGQYAYKITAVNANGESGGKLKNQIDDSRVAPPIGFSIPDGKAARIWWYVPDPAYGSQPTGWNIYRAKNPVDASKFTSFNLMDTITHDPALVQTGQLYSYVDDGTQAATGKHPPSEGDNNAWTTEWRCSPGAVLHNVSTSVGKFADSSSGGRLTEQWNWGGAATKIPLVSGVITEQEVLDFRERLAECRALGVPCDYVFPHALSWGAPKNLSSNAKYAYPAQAPDGANGLLNDCVVQGARFFLPAGLDPKTTMNAILNGLPDLNTAPTAYNPAVAVSSQGPALATDHYNGTTNQVDEWILAVFRTMQVYGGFVHDSLSAWVLYAESPDVSVGRETPIDPVNPNWPDMLVDDDAPHISAYSGSNSVTISAQKQIRRFQQFGQIPWDQLFVPQMTVCLANSGECHLVGQDTTDRTWTLGDAVMGDSFGGPGTNGQLLENHTGTNTGWVKIDTPTNAGQIILTGGRTRAYAIPALYAMTAAPPSQDYGIRSSLGVFDSFTDTVVGGAFLFEHAHRIPINVVDGVTIANRRHYVGLGYNSAAHAFVIRVFTHTDPAGNPFPQVLATLDADMIDDDQIHSAESFVIGNYAALYWDGQLMVETEIPVGWETGHGGLNVGFPQGDQDSIQFDGIWLDDKTTVPPPGKMGRIFKLGDGRTAKVVLP